jgi:TRAP transporter TAXI family solute receptor
MKKLIIASIFFATTCFANDQITLYTGNMTGLYYSIGSEICDILNCNIVTSSGSIENIQKLKDDPTSLAIIQSDALAKFSNELTIVRPLYTEAYTFIVTANSNIASFPDLKDKIVNVGKTNSGSYFAVENLLNLYKMNFSNFKATKQLTINQQGTALCQGKIDAYIYVAGHPNLSLQATAHQCSVKIIGIDDQIAQNLVTNNKAFSFTEIAANLYPFNHDPIKTLGIKAVLVASKNMDPNVLSKLKDMLDKSYNDLKSRNSLLNGINLD